LFNCRGTAWSAKLESVGHVCELRSLGGVYATAGKIFQTFLVDIGRFAESVKIRKIRGRSRTKQLSRLRQIVYGELFAEFRSSYKANSKMFHRLMARHDWWLPVARRKPHVAQFPAAPPRPN
jgi:hypothetical protein